MSHGLALRLSQAAIRINTKHSLAAREPAKSWASAREPEKSWAAARETTKSWVAVDNWVHFSGLKSVERTYLSLSKGLKAVAAS
jgi:hypothetical protein